MSRDTRFDWLICRFSARSRRNARRELRAATHRRLRHEPLEDRRLLAVVTVTTLADSVDLADGKLSLREAIFATNTVPGPDTVEFDPALSAAGPATILLTQGEMAITDALTIAGPGAALLTIDASGNDTNPATPGNGSRIFNIDNHAVSVVDVTLSGITLTGGDTDATGGAILSREHLSVDGMVFTGNRAQSGGAIAQLQSSAQIANSTFESNGAASDGGAVIVDSLAAGATVTVSANHFTSNSAMRGGAIATRPPGGNAVLVIDGNTIVANNATGQGGGIALPQGPLLRVAIQSSTISGNTAGSQGGGVFAIGARDLAIVDSNISNNHSGPGGPRGGGGTGGGVYLAISDVSITGSTIAGNESNSGGGVYSFNGDLAISFSTIANNTAVSGQGGGIFSRQDRFSLVGSTVSGNTAVGTNPGGGGGIWLATRSSPAVLADSLIEGNSATGAGGGVYFRTGYDGPSSNSLTLDNVTLTQNSALNGGGIFAATAISNLTGPGLVFNGGAVSGNTAATDGGGVYSRLQNLTVNHTTISGNQALRNGGAIALPQSAGIFVQVSIVGAVMEGNVASAGTIEGPGTGDGGAIWIVSNMSTLSVIDSKLNNNSARNGGAIFRRATTPSGPVSISASSITGNTVRLSGGGLYNYRGPLVISNSTIAGNGASPLPGSDGQGGGIFNRQGDVSMNASSLTGNNAPSRGGGLYHDQGDLTVTASTIAGNSAGFDGGGVLALTSSQVDRIAIQSSTVSGNSAPRTGGFYLRGDTTIRQSTIVGNAGGRGGAGGIVVGDGSSRFELDHSIVAKNTQTGFAPPDIRFFGSMFNVTLRWSLIGDSDGSMLVEAPLGSPDVNGNLIGKSVSAGGSGVIDPLVGPLANNGGPTLTHALLPGSPALDSGALVTGQPLGYDQRGNPYSRMVDGTGDGVIHIDVGAYESQGVPHFTPGDYNRDGSVDACDYTIWRSTLGNSVAPFEGADGDGDGTIDADDYAIWKSHFGQGLTFLPAERGAVLAVASGAVAEVAPALGPPPEVVRAANRAARIPVRLPTHRPISATNSDALLAWLSTHPGARAKHDRPDPKTPAASHRDVARRAELDGRLTAAVDAAFARIGA